MALCPGPPRWAGTIRMNHSRFCYFAKAETMGWQCHQPHHMQIICTSLQTDNHASTASLSFLQAYCSSCCPSNSIKALKAHWLAEPLLVDKSCSNNYTARQNSRNCCLFTFVTDLFEKVVPLALQQALTMFENRRAELVNREIGRLREATQLMNR